MHHQDTQAKRSRNPAAGRVETVEGLYEQLAERRFRESARTLELGLRTPRGRGLLGDMAVILEDAAAVISVIAIRCPTLQSVGKEMDGQARALVTLAGRLEQAADLNTAA